MCSNCGLVNRILRATMFSLQPLSYVHDTGRFFPHFRLAFVDARGEYSPGCPTMLIICPHARGRNNKVYFSAQAKILATIMSLTTVWWTPE